MSHSFTSEGARKNSGERRRAAQSPAPLRLRKDILPHLTHLYPGPQSLVWHSLTHTRAVVRSQLEAWLTLAAKRAWQVHTSVLAIAVATLVYI